MDVGDTTPRILGSVQNREEELVVCLTAYSTECSYLTERLVIVRLIGDAVSRSLFDKGELFVSSKHSKQQLRHILAICLGDLL
ncbi:hypothetical protein HZ326_11193 [Fusarium oxysporum f. sp. albedinis]|nr:hypothetical protein HZ326_11193 [Fusarium oxysporum f. sp. albedinis]